MKWYKRTRDAKVCVWIKHDDVCFLVPFMPTISPPWVLISQQIHMMLRALLSVQANTPEACTVVFVHAYPTAEDIPTELEPNTRILDEAFPMVTIECVSRYSSSSSNSIDVCVWCLFDCGSSSLAFVKGTFSPCVSFLRVLVLVCRVLTFESCICGPSSFTLLLKHSASLRAECAFFISGANICGLWAITTA